MSRFDEGKFNKYWRETEIIREYQQILYTFGDMQIPYLFVAEHIGYSDRTVIRKGFVDVQKPRIFVPGSYGGPEFKEGFEHFNTLPSSVAFMIRTMGLPYSEISNKQIIRDEIEYGGLQEVIEKLNNKFEQEEDIHTGLIKGITGGADISLMRYAIGLMVKSAPENFREFFEHFRRRRGEPIRPDEKITDEDIKKAFRVIY